MAVVFKSNGQEFQYCQYEDDLGIYWPDWQNPSQLITCNGIGELNVYSCNDPLLFSFVNQVKKSNIFNENVKIYFN